MISKASPPTHPVITCWITFWVLVCANVRADGPLMLIATGGRQETTHDGTTNPQRFPPHKWILIAPQSTFGATVTWECGPFQHVDLDGYLADVQLEVSVESRGANNAWGVLVPFDRTFVRHGNNQASVVAHSRHRGNAQVELHVTMLENEQGILASGDYEAVVIATITEN
ncbi:MAG: hypothetical protein KDA80_24540 [Planctomycetaceae bacterium]|nr:hypothetical protein [Planctomycetaceae bacterium]